MKPPSRFVMASLTWNAYRWRAMDKISPTQHEYAKHGPRHESLNFVFDKRGVDDGVCVYGYMPGAKTEMPGFEQPGIIFFHSTNYTRHVRKIVGIYGNAYRINGLDVDKVDGFDGPMFFNIVAHKQYSMLFPTYLDLDGYFDTKNIRRATKVYTTGDVARQIIEDEMKICKKRKDLDKLRLILKLVDQPIEGQGT